MTMRIAGISLVLITVIQAGVLSQSGTGVCLVDVPTISPPTEVFSDHISTTLAIGSSSISFEGGTVDVNSVDDGTVFMRGITVSGDPLSGKGGGLVFESGTVQMTNADRASFVHGLVIDQNSAAHFKDGTISISSMGGPYVWGVRSNGDFIMDGGTIEINAGEEVFYPTGLEVSRQSRSGSTTIINGGTIRVNGSLHSLFARGISVFGPQTSTVIINGGNFEVTGSPLRPGVFLEVSGSANACIFGGSVGNGSNAVELNHNAKLFIFGTGFNLPVNTPITNTEGMITGTLHDGSSISWSFNRRDDNATIMLVEQSGGDFNSNGILDSNDLDLLAIQQVSNAPDLAFDLTGDGAIGIADRDSWLNQYRRTWFGDFNLDDVFATSDLVQAMQSGKYRSDDVATFAEGDANGDLRFDTNDLTRILAGGGYETATAFPAGEALRAIPEPPGIVLLALAMISICSRRSRRTRSP
jgi:hypothetical protein